MLRRYYRYLYLNQYIILPLKDRLPHASIQGRMKFPTIWDLNQIEMMNHLTKNQPIKAVDDDYFSKVFFVKL